jgi:hypothetical protein
MLHVANPANLVNSANLVCSSIYYAVWANPIYLPVRVAVLANPVNLAWVMLLRLANPVNPAVVTQIFSLVHDLCSSTFHPRVAQPDHLVTLEQYHTCSLRVLPVL